MRGLWDGYYVQPGGAKYHNPVDILTENFSTGALTGTDNGTDGAATVTLTISGRTISGTIDQPATNYSAQVSWTLSDDGTKLIAGGITDPTAPNAFVLFRHGAPVGATNALTSGAGVTSGPAPINALPTPAEAFSSPGRIVASAAISIAALLFITFPANLFNKTFEENYDVIVAWWEPRLRRFRRKQKSSTADAGEPAADSTRRAPPIAPTHCRTTTPKDDRVKFALVVIAGAIFGGLLNPKFGANSASVNSFVATLLSVILGTAVGTAVGFLYRRRKKYDVTRHFEALPAGLAIAALCVVLSRLSNFQPGYLYGVVCGVAFAGTLAKNENGHLVALGHLATIAVAVVAWFVWVPVNHSALHHPGVFPLVILDDLLASLFVGGLVGSVINLIPVRFMPGSHPGQLASRRVDGGVRRRGIRHDRDRAVPVAPQPRWPRADRHDHRVVRGVRRRVVGVPRILLPPRAASLGAGRSRWTSQRRDRSPPNRMRTHRQKYAVSRPTS